MDEALETATEAGMRSYRVGVIGLSWITTEPPRAGTHPVLGAAVPHTHLTALATMPNVTVVAGCDISPEACTRFRETWDATWPGVRTHTDYRELIDREEIDLLCVATPDHLHGEIVRTAAASGIPAIFCEKPLSVSLDDADAMIAAIEAHGTLVQVNNTRRWVPAYVAAREAIRSGTIGALSQVVISYGGPRAMLWRNHAHFLDLASYFAESDPAWLTAELEPGFGDYGLEYKGDGGRSPELEPGVNAYIAYANGVRVVINGWKSSTPQVNVDVYGAEARIHVADGGASLVRQEADGLATIPLVPQGTRQSFQAAIQDLMMALETGTDVQSPPREARKTVALIEAILASQAAGNTRVAVG
jgi:predicted dehydrogenase